MAIKKYLQTNCAGKLAILLEKAVATNSPNGQMLNGWATLFDVPAQPLPTVVIDEVIKFQNLVNLVHERMLKLDYERDIYEKPLFDLIEAIGVSLHNLTLHWDGFKSQISSGTISAIKACAVELNKVSDNEPDPDEITKLEESTNALLQDISDSSLPENTKRGFELLLYSILDDIRTYRVFGINHLDDKYKAVLGEMLVSGEDLKNSEQIKSKLWVWFGGFERAIRTSHPALALFKEAAKLISQ